MLQNSSAVSMLSARESMPVDIKDVLSYIKIQFEDKLAVYNHFLNIMGDFKRQL
jgi:histone deacetylase complex regulatory component SIN3